MSASEAGSGEEALGDWVKISSEKTEKIAYYIKLLFSVSSGCHMNDVIISSKIPFVPKVLHRGVFILTHSITE